MKTRLLHIFTRTPLHVGAGTSVGAIDQPVVRERHTGFPIIPGSSIKGVMRDHLRQALQDKPESLNVLFGWTNDENSMSQAGAFSFSEAKLLAFPLRSAKGSFALATCPLALQRYARYGSGHLELPQEPSPMTCLAGDAVVLNRLDGKRGVALEEYAFSHEGAFPEEWAEHLSSLLEDAVLKGAQRRWVLLSNEDFSHFAQSATQVLQHVRIDDKTGTAETGGLFNEETVPPESLFFSAITELPIDCEKEAFVEALSNEQLVQFGGNGTTGLGFCTVKLS